jgi:regulatory protein
MTRGPQEMTPKQPTTGSRFQPATPTQGGSWREARLTADELEARRLERKARPALKQAPDPADPADPTDPATPADPADPADLADPADPSPWRAARLDERAREEREEERALKAGERAERRAKRAARASGDLDRARASRRAEAPPPPPLPPSPPNERPDAPELRAKPARTPQARGRARAPIDGAWLKDASLRYLGRFSSSESNLRRVLKQKIRDAESLATDDPLEHARWVNEAVEYARAAGGVNDEALARSLLAAYRRQGLAAAMIRQKMSLKGLGAQTIKEAFEAREEAVDPLEDQLRSAARAAQRRKIGPWGPGGLDYPARQKQLAVLARKGFSFEVSKRVLEAPLEQAEAWASACRDSD